MVRVVEGRVYSVNIEHRGRGLSVLESSKDGAFRGDDTGAGDASASTATATSTSSCTPTKSIASKDPLKILSEHIVVDDVVTDLFRRVGKSVGSKHVGHVQTVKQVGISRSKGVLLVERWHTGNRLDRAPVR